MIYFLADWFVANETWRYTIQIVGLIWGIVFYGGRTITAGGDIIRPHFRRTTTACRTACPNCGYNLQAQLKPVFEAIHTGGANFPLYRAMLKSNPDFEVPPICCPECGVTTETESFMEPFQINCDKKSNRKPQNSA